MPDDEMSGSAQGESVQKEQRRRNRRRPQSRRNNAFAALDLGTNNCRLLVARPASSGFQVIDSYSRVVRLGKGLTATGRLSDESMQAAVEAIGVCASKMKNKGVKRWRCIATQACRAADNGEEFLSRVKAETGLTFETISPRVEARLAVMGCLNLIDKSKDVVLVIDIGGGSTELSWVDIRRLRQQSGGRIHRPPIAAWASLPIGVVTLSEMIPETDNKTEWFGALKAAVHQAIVNAGCEQRFANVFKEGRGHLIGTSGTITSLAGIHLGLPYYQRDKVDGLWMNSADAVSVARHMGSLDFDGRAAEPCIGTDRAGLLVAGCAIIDVLCELWPSEKFRVADRGLREGILMGLMDQSSRQSKSQSPSQSPSQSNGNGHSA